MSKNFIGGEPTKRHKHRTVLKDVRKKDERKLYEQQVKQAKLLNKRPPMSPIQKRIGARRIA